MNSLVKRSVDVDFLRGVALIVIALDHNFSGVLQYATLHTYAYCDAAELFVFVGGYVSASAYVSIASSRGENAARFRFLRRALEIYCAYLVTALLMLTCSAVCTLLHTGPTPTDAVWMALPRHPLQTLFDIILFREQPFLSAVLPMYVAFALCVPFSVPIARRSPSWILAISLAAWMAAPWLGADLPSRDGAGWPFNPYAWQLIFTFGILCRLHPIPPHFHLSDRGRQLTSVAIGIALTIALVRLRVDVRPSPGYMKQNLASIRIVSFLAVAWLCAQAVRMGWIRRLARFMPAVVAIGQQGLLCFVAGTFLSIFANALVHFEGLRTPPSSIKWPLRLAADALIVVLLILFARVAKHLKHSQRDRTAVNGGGAYGA
ncbi:OpgC domain-containing protein [Paraburkholderia sacchari]|uniref:OpgC domain-containing protein n=1 Tax=Paraburkholderia sacchari TaxID=159450 RepID=UPI003D9550AC